MKVLKLGQSLCSSNAPAAAWANKYSLEFDAVDDYVDVGNDASLRPALSGGATISFWTKNPTLGKPFFATGQSATTYAGILISIGGTGKLFCSTGNNFGLGSTGRRTFNSTNNVFTSTTVWYHVVMVLVNAAQTSWIGYIDGAAVPNGTSGTGASIVYTTNNTELGHFSYNSAYLGGKLDEVGFWDSALSAAEVAAIYNGGSPTDLTVDAGNYASSGDLVGYWRNGDTAGSSVYPTIEDYSTNSNDGTMTNMTDSDIITDVP